LALVVVDEKPVWRLTDISFFTGHYCQAKKWLMLLTLSAVATSPLTGFRSTITPLFQASFQSPRSVRFVSKLVKKSPGFHVSLRILLLSSFANSPSQFAGIKVGIPAIHQAGGYRVFKF